VSDRQILIEEQAGLLRAALLLDRRLTAIEIDRPRRPSRVGAVAAGRRTRTLPGLGPVVSLSDGSEWLLEPRRGEAASAAGDPRPVQIVRAPRGDKLGVVSGDVARAGRALIHLPLETGIRMSRRLAAGWDGAAGLRVALADRPGGWIVRRTAPLVGADDLAAEISALEAEAEALRRAAELPAPDAVRRLLCDAAVPAPDRILVSGRAAEDALRHWCAGFAPSLDARIALYRDAPGLFDAFDLETELARLADPRVALAKGGSLVIEPTEALTAIDVNAGRDANPLAADLGAVPEIARQLRLRHIGGLVVVDFVSLARPADRARVTASLAAALADDPARTQILPMSELGLVEMARERRGPDLELDDGD
jgi:ribonuclease E/ribonuclease G